MQAKVDLPIPGRLMSLWGMIKKSVCVIKIVVTLNFRDNNCLKKGLKSFLYEWIVEFFQWTKDIVRFQICISFGFRGV